MEIRKYLTFFENKTIQVFFFNHMPQKYQNEKSPILNGQKKSKTLEKDKKNEGFRGTYLNPPF